MCDAKLHWREVRTELGRSDAGGWFYDRAVVAVEDEVSRDHQYRSQFILKLPLYITRSTDVYCDLLRSTAYYASAVFPSCFLPLFDMPI